MTDAGIVERSRKVVAGLLKIPESSVTPTAHFVKDLGMASVQSVELVAAFEEEFDLDIEQDEVAGSFTLEEAAAWIEQALAKQNV